MSSGHRRIAENNESYDLHYFDQWSPSMAYILGFLFADGCITQNLGTVRVSIVTEDEEVLQFIRKELKSKTEIKRKKSRVSYSTACHRKPISILGIYSKIIVERLVSLGMKPRKSYNDDPPPEVPDEMFPHFLRGLFDGDGCVSVFESGKKDHRVISCCVNICGSIKLITWIRDTLVRLLGMRLAGVKIKKGKTADLAVITWGAYEDIGRFHAYIYGDGHFCLARKERKLDEWLSRPHRKRRQKIS